MGIRHPAFNLFLSAALLAATAGCESLSPTKRELANFSVFAQANDGDLNSDVIEVFRANPFKVRIEKEPFVDERNLTEANLVENLGSYSIEVQFDLMGTSLLEQYTGLGSGRRLAIYCEFQGGEVKQKRWLAAPIIPRSIHNGKLVFAPDASRDEAELIVRGLKATIRQYPH